MEIKEEDYIKTIKAKTAQLFSSSAEIIPILANLDVKIINKNKNSMVRNASS